MIATDEQRDLFEWADARPIAEIIDILPYVALRMWRRREWPKPQNPCETPINLPTKRGAA